MLLLYSPSFYRHNFPLENNNQEVLTDPSSPQGRFAGWIFRDVRSWEFFDVFSLRTDHVNQWLFLVPLKGGR